MHLMCLNTRVHCVSAIGYDGFVFCNLAITSLAIIIQDLTQTNCTLQRKKNQIGTPFFWISELFMKPGLYRMGLWNSATCVIWGKSKKEKVIMIVVPVNPIGQRKRQDDVLSFQKITGSYYHFIAYLSLLNDRPNSFYHLNFNFFEF